MKRTSKFYFKNEKEVAKLLGLKPIPGSGSGWISKEDMESDKILAQLKSTDKDSYTLHLLDIKKLEYNSTVSHKIPVFLIQFLHEERIYGLVPIEVLNTILPNQEPIKQTNLVITTCNKVENIKQIKSTKKARSNFYKEKEDETYGKRKSKTRRKLY